MHAHSAVLLDAARCELDAAQRRHGHDRRLTLETIHEPNAGPRWRDGGGTRGISASSVARAAMVPRQQLKHEFRRHEVGRIQTLFRISDTARTIEVPAAVVH